MAWNPMAGDSRIRVPSNAMRSSIGRLRPLIILLSVSRLRSAYASKRVRRHSISAGESQNGPGQNSA